MPRRVALTLAAAAGLTAGAAAMARRRLIVVTVDGDSMQPALGHGDRVLVLRSGRVPVPGSVVLGTVPGSSRARFIKRVAAPGPQVPAVPPGHCWVLGDAPRSADSRLWGPVPHALITGHVVRRLRRAPSQLSGVTAR